MPAPRPLPRSLVPIPGESLPGFLLRLSCRLNQPPAKIAGLTGLARNGAGGAHVPVILLAGIPETGSGTFTRMTRLTSAQAAQLGTATWQERYPPIIASPESKARGARRLDGRLIFAPATRYCPQCLAGNGSAIQEAFGGPWLKAWHLPVVFACPVHKRLLEHLCPGCGQAVRGRRPGSNAGLLPAMLATGLHSAQCRTQTAQRTGRHPVCCGARLDQDSRHRPASPGLIALQDKILGLLDPDGPAATISAGTPAPPASYFSDLRALALLACHTWPAARHLSPGEDAASAVDQHVGSLRKQAAARHAGSPGNASRARLDYSFPPADAAASSGLVHIADSILAGSRDDVREQLLLLLPFGTRNAGQSRWGLSMARMAIPCSEGLQAAYAPVLRTFTKTGGSQGRRDAVLRPERWGPENVPAFLPQDWYARHFKPIAGVSDRFIRRTGALRLVQMAAGGSLSDAAQLLGIASAGTAWPGYGIYAGAGQVHSGARKQHGPLSFENALEALAREIDNPATPLVNYQSRRQALQTWSIDEDTWTSITNRLPPAPGPQQPDLGDRKRQLASIYVWVQVTSGEHLFAPRPIEAIMPPSLRKPWTRWTSAWKLLDPGHRGPHYTSLKAELGTIATSLARTIDNRC
jgi:TniQ